MGKSFFQLGITSSEKWNAKNDQTICGTNQDHHSEGNGHQKDRFLPECAEIALREIHKHGNEGKGINVGQARLNEGVVKQIGTERDGEQHQRFIAFTDLVERECFLQIEQAQEQIKQSRHRYRNGVRRGISIHIVTACLRHHMTHEVKRCHRDC